MQQAEYQFIVGEWTRGKKNTVDKCHSQLPLLLIIINQRDKHEVQKLISFILNWFMLSHDKLQRLQCAIMNHVLCLNSKEMEIEIVRLR